MGTCLECRVNIIGRIDKKFCSDGCRNAYHNKIYRIENCDIKHINRILAKNHRILKELFDKNIRKCTKKMLSEQGFNFAYFTSSEQDTVSSRNYFCYNFEYFYIDKELIFIVQKK